MSALSRMLFVVIAIMCAASTRGAETNTPELSLKHLVISGFTYHYFREYTLHPVTDEIWASRESIGISVDAHRCGGPFFVTSRIQNAIKTNFVGLVVDDEQGGVRAVEVETNFPSDEILVPRLLYAVVTGKAIVLPPNNYLVLPNKTQQQLRNCALSREQFT